MGFISKHQDSWKFASRADERMDEQTRVDLQHPSWGCKNLNLGPFGPKADPHISYWSTDDLERKQFTLDVRS